MAPNFLEPGFRPKKPAQSSFTAMAMPATSRTASVQLVTGNNKAGQYCYLTIAAMDARKAFPLKKE
jgi:hypothetical protein